MSLNSLLLKIDNINSTLANYATVSHLPLAALIGALPCPGHIQSPWPSSTTLGNIVIAVVCASSICIFIYAWHEFKPLNCETTSHDLGETSAHLVPYTGVVGNSVEVSLERKDFISPRVSRNETIRVSDGFASHVIKSSEKLTCQSAGSRRQYAFQSEHDPLQLLECNIYTLVERAVMICEQRQQTRRSKMEQSPAIQAMMEQEWWWVNLYPILYGNESKKDAIKRLEKIKKIKSRGSHRCKCHGNELRVAITSGRPEFFRYLLGTGLYDVNERDAQCRSPLTQAAALGSVEIVETLISYGARVNIGGDPGLLHNRDDPFGEACCRGHHRVAESLLRQACDYGKAALVAVLLRWREVGAQWHRDVLPLNQCVQFVRRGHFGSYLPDRNVCKFLACWKESVSNGVDAESDPYGIFWDSHKRAVVIIEMLIEVGVKHMEECDCGAGYWAGGHHILLWNQHREEAEREQRDAEKAKFPAIDDDTDDRLAKKTRPNIRPWPFRRICNCQYCTLKFKERRDYVWRQCVNETYTIDDFDTEAGEYSDETSTDEEESGDL